MRTVGALQAREITSWHRRGGAVLVAVSGLSLLATTLTGEMRSWFVPAWLVAVGVVIVIVVALGRLADRRWLLVWPLAIMGCVLVSELVSPQAATLTLGMLTIAFLLVGLTQRRWTSLPLVIPAVALYLGAIHLPASQLAVRVSLGVFIWVCVAEIPAALADGLRQMRRDLQRLAETDDLTDLLNRRGWDERLTALTQDADRDGQELAVVLLDVDHFKSFNDSVGHLRGDDLLREVAEVLRAQAGPRTLVARWGGDEFGMAVPGCSMTEAGRTAERLLAAMPEEHRLSAGVAAYQRGEGIRLLVHRADVALYEAKRLGRNRVVTSPQAG